MNHVVDFETKVGIIGAGELGTTRMVSKAIHQVGAGIELLNESLSDSTKFITNLSCHLPRVSTICTPRQSKHAKARQKRFRARHK